MADQEQPETPTPRSELIATYHAINNEFGYSRDLMQLYLQMFCDKDVVAMWNRLCPYAMATIQRTLISQHISVLAKLCDPAEQGPKSKPWENCTLERLGLLAARDGRLDLETFIRVNLQMNEDSLAEVVRVRKKFLAHFDQHVNVREPQRWRLDGQAINAVEGMIRTVLIQVRGEYAIEVQEGRVPGRDRHMEEFFGVFPGGGLDRVVEILTAVEEGRPPEWPEPIPVFPDPKPL